MIMNLSEKENHYKKIKDITIYSNFVILLKQEMPSFSWVGFYFFDEKQNSLILGPYSGNLACNYIPLSNGICGEAARKRTTIVIKDVNNIPYHIACDSLSKSEIVSPIIINNKLICLLDIDSYALNNFNDIDKLYIEKMLSIISNSLSNSIIL